MDKKNLRKDERENERVIADGCKNVSQARIDTNADKKQETQIEKTTQCCKDSSLLRSWVRAEVLPADCV